MHATGVRLGVVHGKVGVGEVGVGEVGVGEVGVGEVGVGGVGVVGAGGGEFDFLRAGKKSSTGLLL